MRKSLFILFIFPLFLLAQETKEYHENGQLKSIYTLKNGKKDGVVKIYYENGNLWGTGHMKDGKPDGKCVQYFENGNLESEENYKYGKLDGWKITYYEDYDQINLKIYFSNDNPAELIGYYENGQLKMKGYMEGTKVIFNECWNGDGTKANCN